MRKFLLLLLVYGMFYTNIWAQTWENAFKTADKKLDQGAYAKAIDAFQKVASTLGKQGDPLLAAWVDVAHARAYEGMGNFDLMQQKLASAEAVWQSADKSSPKAFYRYAAGVVRGADVWIEATQYNKAEQILNAALAEWKKQATADSLLYAELTLQLVRIKTAQGYLNQALALNTWLKYYLKQAADNPKPYGWMPAADKIDKFSTLDEDYRKSLYLTAVVNSIRTQTQVGAYDDGQKEAEAFEKQLNDYAKSKSPEATLFMLAMGENELDYEKTKSAEETFQQASKASKKTHKWNIQAQINFLIAQTYNQPASKIKFGAVAVPDNSNVDKKDPKTDDTKNKETDKKKKKKGKKETTNPDDDDNNDVEDAGSNKALSTLLKTVAKTYPGENIYQAKISFLQGNMAFYARQVAPALANLNRALAVNTTNLPELHTMRPQMLKLKYEIQTELALNLPEAQKNIETANDLMRQIVGDKAPAYLLYQLELGNYLTQYSNDVPKLRAIFDAHPQDTIFNEIIYYHKDYAALVNYVSAFFELTDDFMNAIDYAEEVKIALDMSYGQQSVETAYQQIRLAELLSRYGEYPAAQDTLKKAIAILEGLKGKDTPEYKYAMQAQARLFNIMGLYDKAAEILNTQVKKQDLKAGKMVASEDNAAVLAISGKYDDAEAVLNQILSYKEKTYGTDNKILIGTLIQYADLMLTKGKYTEADRLSRRSMIIAEVVLGDTSLRYSQAANIQAQIYLNLGDFERAVWYLEKALKIQDRILGEYSIEIAHSLITLAAAEYSIDIGFAEKSEKKLMDAQKIISKSFGDEHPLYADALQNLAIIHIENDKFDVAYANLTEAENIWVDKLGKRNVNAAEVQTLLGDVLTHQNKFVEAEEEYLKAQKTYRKLFSKQHPSYLRTTGKLGQMYYIMGDFDKATKALQKTTAEYLNFINVYFPGLSEREKARFWNIIRPDIEFYNNLILKQKDTRPELLAEMFDYSLATKAVLLNSSVKIRQSILNSNDEELKTKFDRWLTLKDYISKSLNVGEEAEADSAAALNKVEREIEGLEKELSEKSAEFAQSLLYAQYDWKDIRLALKKEEAAVEIIRLRYFDKDFRSDSILYAALVVTAETKKNPDLVLLSNGKDLETRYLNYYRNSIRNQKEDGYSYSKFWQPIEASIGDKPTIYLSADGVYNQVSMSSLLIDSTGSYVLDRTHIVVMSSSRDLIEKAGKGRKSKGKTTTQQAVTYANNAILIGNPVFYEALGASPTEDKVEKMRSSTKNFITQLPGTAGEIEEITAILKANSWEVFNYVLSQATEEQMKTLPSTRVLHIATHGFFIPDQKVDNHTGLNRQRQEPLLRSGLLLEGSGDFLRGNYTEGDEDGVLTAYEVMNLNFDKTELVILSACETGLGDVQVGEGVFGLQRAFGVAGAKAVVMSLFKVSDEATQKLMVSFYRKWLELGNKNKAFYEAQKELKQSYGHPLYWGTFTMMGID